MTKEKRAEKLLEIEEFVKSEDMTKETAERIVKGITDKIENNTADINDWAEFWGFTVDEYEEFLDMPIKSLEQEPIKDAFLNYIRQVVKERDIAIEQLNELGYSLGEKIRPCEKEQESIIGEVRAEIEKQEKWLAQAGYNAYNVGIAFGSIKRALRK